MPDNYTPGPLEAPLLRRSQYLQQLLAANQHGGQEIRGGYGELIARLLALGLGQYLSNRTDRRLSEARRSDIMTQVLIVHASKYGSVEEVARYIAAVLRDEGAACDLVAACDAVDLEGYDLVVLGTGLYMNRVHRDARHFLHENHAALTHQPFAVFALGPLSSEPEEKDKVRPPLEHALERYPELEPAAIAIFGGVIDPERMSFPFNRMPAGDHRDWDEIRSFARSLPIRPIR